MTIRHGGLVRALPTVLLVAAVAPDAVAQPAGAYAHYTPGACVQAVLRTERMQLRTGADTARADYANARVHPAAADVARDCAARLRALEVRPRDLVLLARVQLAAGDDAGARRSIARRLAQESRAAADVRAATLAEVVAAFIQAEPHRVSDARAHLARLDSIARPGALIGRLQAHATMLAHHVRSHEDADAAREAEAVLALGTRLDAHDRHEFVWALRMAHAELVRAAAESRGAGAAREALARARADIGAIGEESARLTRWDSVYALYGRRATRLTADRVLNAPAGATFPAPGRTSLLVFGAGRSTMPSLRRLERRFGEQVQIVIANRTVGFFRGEGPFASAVELDSLSRYLVAEVSAPGAILLSAAGAGQAPDGRLARHTTPNEDAYHVEPGTFLVVFDPGGIIRYVSTALDEARLEQRIAEALAPAAVGSGTR